MGGKAIGISGKDGKFLEAVPKILRSFNIQELFKSGKPRTL